jgi:hypothetical protein
LYRSFNTARGIDSRRLGWAGKVVRMKKLAVLTGEPKGKRPLGRSRPKWEEN